MPAMTPEELHQFLEEHFPQAAHLDLRIEHLDDTTIRVRLPTKEQHLRPDPQHFPARGARVDEAGDRIGTEGSSLVRRRSGGRPFR